MKENLKKPLGLLLCGAVTLSSLSGCGISNGTGVNDSGNESNNAAQTDADSEKTPADGSVTLTVTNFFNTISEDFLNALHDACPGVELEITSYSGTNASGYAQHSLEHGDIPDIYIATQNFSPESQEKYLLDLSNYDFINNYSNSLLDAQDVNGGIYLLPTSYQLIGINYNKTILSENGWEIPGSFNELVELSERIEAAGYKAFGNAMSLDGYVDSYFFNLGNTIYFGTPEGTEWKEDFPRGEAKASGNNGIKEVAEYFNEWVENGFFTGEHMSTTKFYEGECVFYAGLGITVYEHTAENGKTYEFGTMPWLSKDGSNNMLTRNVSKYIGLSKSLTDKGNEQKLDAALKFMAYLSTVEGQQAFTAGNNLQVPSLNTSEITQDSPYYEVADLIYEGRTVPLVYVGWEQILTPMADKLRLMLSGELDVNGLVEGLDEVNEALLNGVSEDMYGTASETLTLEETAALVAIAEGMAVDADCALISLNEYHGPGLFNTKGLAWYLYEGNINTEAVNTIRPSAATISIIDMSGAQIKAMCDAGFAANEGDNPYEYLLFTKGNIELYDAVTYKLAISTGELTADMLESATETEISPAAAIEAYVTKLGTVSAENIRWE